MNHAHDTPPGEARPDANHNGLMFRLMRATVAMMRIKAVLVVRATPALEALEKEYDALPDGEERRRLTEALEDRYSGFIRLWAEGLISEDATTGAGPDAEKG